MEVSNLMRKLAGQLFPDVEAEQTAFLDSLTGAVRQKQSALIWTDQKKRDDLNLEALPDSEVPDWVPAEVSFLLDGEEPGKSELFRSGDIYPVDLSSIYTASAMLLTGQPRRILDMCAAPGGKTVFASAVLKPDFLLANEVIGKRLGILCHNLRKTGLPGTFTQSIDPGEWQKLAASAFDLVLVDAPCSGQSLLVKGKKNPGCFHPNIVKGNAKRQLRILSQSAACVAPGGYLFYSTCTFAIRENETVVEKFLLRNPEFESVEVPHLDQHRSALSDEFAYRIYPHEPGCGAGGFVSLMRRAGRAGDLPELPDTLLSYPVRLP